MFQLRRRTGIQEIDLTINKKSEGVECLFNSPKSFSHCFNVHLEAVGYIGVPTALKTNSLSPSVNIDEFFVNEILRVADYYSRWFQLWLF